MSKTSNRVPDLDGFFVVIQAMFEEHENWPRGRQEDNIGAILSGWEVNGTVCNKLCHIFWNTPQP